MKMSTTTNVPSRPFLDEGDGEILAGIVNRVADSFDVAELSDEEALMAYILFHRMMTSLLNEHRALLAPVDALFMARRREQDDDPDDGIDDGSNGGAKI